MHFRFRLVDDTGADLGPFASERGAWVIGERIARRHGEELEVVAFTAADAGDSVAGYLIVRDAAAGCDRLSDGALGHLRSESE